MTENTSQQLGPSGRDDNNAASDSNSNSVANGNQPAASGSKSTAGGNPPETATAGGIDPTPCISARGDGLSAPVANSAQFYLLQNDVRKLEDKLEGIMEVLQQLRTRPAQCESPSRPAGVPFKQRLDTPVSALEAPRLGPHTVTSSLETFQSSLVTFSGVDPLDMGPEHKVSQKALDRVQHLKPPGGMAWQGTLDSRCGARFIADAATIAVEANLTDEALVMYFRKKCIQPELDERLAEVCADLYAMRPVPFDKILTRMHSHFNTVYAFSNSRSRMMNIIESGTWAKGAKSFDQYMAMVRNVIKDGVTCGISMDEDCRAWVLRKCLPDKLREWVNNWIPEETSLEDTERRIVAHLVKSGNNYYKPQFSGKPAAVKAAGVEGDEAEDAEICAAGRGSCNLCGAQDHFVRD
jgi:hypothetical protein